MVDEIKVAPMHKLIKRAGAERVSEESAIALGRALEEIGVKVAREAMWAEGGSARMASITPAYSVATRVLKYRPVLAYNRSATAWAPAATFCNSPDGT